MPPSPALANPENTMQLPKTKMNKKHWIAIAVLVAVGLVGAVAILRVEPAKPADAHGDEHGHAEEHGDGEHHGEKSDGHGHEDEHADGEHHEEAAKGPHGGQMLTEGDFGLEIQMAEEGGRAFLRAWLSERGKPLPATAAKVSLTLARPDGEQQPVEMIPAKDGLISKEPIAEPHVFDATVEVQTAREPYLFGYSMQEGKIEMTDAQIKAAGISLEAAGPASIRSSLKLPGEIRFNEDRTAHVVPRAAGVVEQVSASLGQRVKKGQVLAVLSSAGVSEQRSELQAALKREQLARATHEREKKLWQEKISPQQDVLVAETALREAEIAVANARQKLQAIGATGTSGDALSRFELRAPFDGNIVEKHVALGELVKEDTNIFTVSDLATVWAEVDVSAKDIGQVRVGEKVAVRSGASSETVGGSVAYVGSLLGEQTRTAKARIVLANPHGAWRPGLFVSVELVTAEAPAAVSVASEAVQQIDDKPVVFVKVPGGFLPQPVELGRSDGKRVEVVKGLKAGSQHASSGSFVIKSEAGKASATHAH